MDEQQERLITNIINELNEYYYSCILIQAETYTKKDNLEELIKNLENFLLELKRFL